MAFRRSSLVFRIADSRHAIFDGTGAMLHGGRWNSPGRQVIYAAETFAGAMLEILVHANAPRIPRFHKLVRIEIPERVGTEIVRREDVPGWNGDDLASARGFGDTWLDQKRSAVLLVPSIVTAGREMNVLINPEHPEFRWIKPGAAEAIEWDHRLFRT